jgi:hypothetical protein
VPGHGGPRDTQPGQREAELPVTVRGLVEVHEVHVDGRPRQGGVGLGVQVQQRAAQRVEAGDPHLGRRERVHPGDDADARRVLVGPPDDRSDRGGAGQHGLPDDPDRHVAGRVDRRRHPLRLLGDLGEGVLAVQALAAGQEPHFLAGEGVVDHDVSFQRCP